MGAPRTGGANRIDHVSDTAYWVAVYRALESERPDALFSDPYAKVLAGERGRGLARSMGRTGRYSYWTVVIRTVLLDSLIRESLAAGYATVINLGAGLDTRPYRLEGLEATPSIHCIELDFPAIVALKDERLKGERPKCRLERIAVDLADDAERGRVFRELDARIGPAVVLTEGVIPYLSEGVVGRLAEDLRDRPRFERWIAEYHSPRLYPRFQAPSFQRRLGDAPFRFFPSDWKGFFSARGWSERESRYLYDVGETAGRRFPGPWMLRILRHVMKPEDLARSLRLQAYVVLGKDEPPG